MDSLARRLNDHFQLEGVIVGLMAPPPPAGGVEEHNGGDADGGVPVDVPQAPELDEEADAPQLADGTDAVEGTDPVPVGEVVESPQKAVLL